MKQKTKNVLICGGTHGIGKILAEAFRVSGNKVKVVGTKNIDFREPFDVNMATFKSVDILVNCQGICQTKKFNKITVNEWDEVMNVNLRSHWMTCVAVIPGMIARGFGRIVNVSSLAGRFRSTTAGVHYSASKAGIIALTRQLAEECAGTGININCVCPGPTNTRMTEGLSIMQRRIRENAIPLKRFAERDEIAKVIYFLCSDLSSYVNGAIVDVNGGAF